MLKQIIALAFLLALSACLPPNVVVLVPDEGGTVGQIAVTKGGVTEQLSQPYATIGTGNGTLDQHVYVASAFVVDGTFAGALAARPRPPATFVVYFAIGQDTVDPGSAASLAEATKTALTTANADISVIGHADATGSDAENLALSLRRATTVRDALVAAGVKPALIEVGYHGSSNPLVKTARGVAEPRNRRVEVTIR